MIGCDTTKWQKIDPRVRRPSALLAFLTLTSLCYIKRFTKLISLNLSLRAKNEVTDVAVDKLRPTLGSTL